MLRVIDYERPAGEEWESKRGGGWGAKWLPRTSVQYDPVILWRTHRREVNSTVLNNFLIHVQGLPVYSKNWSVDSDSWSAISNTCEKCEERRLSCIRGVVQTLSEVLH